MRNSRGSGFYLDAGTIIGEFANVTSIGNDKSGTMAADAVSNLGTGLNLQGNTLDVVDLFNGDMATPQTWPTLNVPYRFDRLSVRGALALSPGTPLLAVSGGSINVSQDGSLNAVGTAAAPISFNGEQATPGYWNGIEYLFSNRVQTVLDHVIISDAGGGGTASTRGNLELTCNSLFPAQLSLSNATITNSVSWGVYTSANGCTVNLGANVYVTGDALGGFNLSP